jgi:uncharacterized BrkB/YihY/UPF0761 family membrane protein
MSDRNKLRFYYVITIMMMIFSFYLLYILVGIFLNANVNLKYDAVSIEDIKYIILYSKILIIYVAIVIIFLALILLKNNKVNKS